MDESTIEKLLERARQIETSGSGGLDNGSKLLFEAAEAAGIQKSAVEMALRERLAMERPPLAEGDLVWALAADGEHRLAEVVACTQQSVEVRYENGATAEIPISATYAFSAVPGNFLEWIDERGRVQTGEILELKPKERWVYVRRPNGDMKYVSYEDARRIRRDRELPSPVSPWWHSVLLWSTGSAILSALITWLLCR